MQTLKIIKVSSKHHLIDFSVVQKLKLHSRNSLQLTFASGLVNFSLCIFFSTYVRDIPLNDKILHSLRKVFGV